MTINFPRSLSTLPTRQLEAEMQKLCLESRTAATDSRLDELERELEERRWRRAA